jgi:hypothetical protein
MSKISIRDKFRSYFDDLFEDNENTEINIHNIDQITQYSNKFFCPQCVKLSDYKRTSDHYISCIKCGDLKIYNKIYSNNLPIIHIGSSIKFRKRTYVKCVACGINDAEFKSVSSKSSVLGISLDCVDTNQPTCFHCHMDMCNIDNHSICKGLNAKL